MSLLLFLKHNYRFFPVSVEPERAPVKRKKRKSKTVARILKEAQELAVEPPSLAPLTEAVLEQQRVERLTKRKRNNVRLFALYRIMYDD